MLRTMSGDTRGYRIATIGLCAGLVSLALAVAPADARGHRRHGVSKTNGGGYSPPYAAIVVDANSGAVLHSSEPDSIRHPASLTKIMTLYLLFERLEQGKIRLDAQLPVSAHAASMAPSKLGLKPGSTIAVEDAIRAVVTKSANDIAVAIAEAVGGDEDTFAEMMTRKARAIGMSRTTYVNASGLPDNDQVTTARDQATLGRAIQERFPRYYRYFSTPVFTYRGESMRNHNHLLGNVEGLDGIKTGFTNKSGFNLVTSVKRNNRHIVSVVLGGSSGGARDARMRALIDKYIVEASLRRTAPMIAEAKEADTAAKPRSMTLASAGDIPFAPAPAKPAAAPIPVPPRTEAALAPKPGSSEPIKPIAVRTIKVKLGSVQTAALAPSLPVVPVVPATPIREERIAPLAAAPVPAPVAPARALRDEHVAAVAAVPTPTPVPARLVAAPIAPAVPVDPTPVASTTIAKTFAMASAESKPVVMAKPEPVGRPEPVAVAKSEPAPVEPAKADPIRKVLHTGWIIQVGAFEAEREARDRLSSAQTKAKVFLVHADAFTEAVTKDNKTLYRARFAGLGKDEAETACKHLKRNDIACMTIKN